MNYTLTNTPNGYNLSIYDVLASLASGLSGIPYAKKHWDLSNHCNPQYRLGHKMISCVQAIPVLGALAAISERITVYIYNHFFNNKPTTTKEKPFTPDIEKAAKSVKMMHPKEIPNISVKLKSHTITNELDEKAFTKYLFSDFGLRKQNKILLENTVCLATPLSKNLTYHNVIPAEHHLEAIMKASLGSKISKITCVTNWFDYTQPNHFYIDFAHATSFGGAYRSFGCVQEERMFAEFRDLAVLDFKTQNGIHPCTDSYDSEGHSTYPPKAKPSPFIIESVHRNFDISNTPYGGPFQKASQETILKGIVKVVDPLPVNIIGLAAVDWRNVTNPKYQLEDLTYHFEAAYLANRGAKEISNLRGWKEVAVHTAPWGCGAFYNSEKMITALQYLAARAADVDLVFHGVGNPMNPHYTQENITEIFGWIEKLIEEKKSIKQILQILLEKSLLDNTWRPKND